MLPKFFNEAIFIILNLVIYILKKKELLSVYNKTKIVYLFTLIT